jgi:hypothetical protein
MGTSHLYWILTSPSFAVHAVWVYTIYHQNSTEVQSLFSFTYRIVKKNKDLKGAQRNFHFKNLADTLLFIIVLNIQVTGQEN